MSIRTARMSMFTNMIMNTTITAMTMTMVMVITATVTVMRRQALDGRSRWGSR